MGDRSAWVTDGTQGAARSRWNTRASYSAKRRQRSRRRYRDRNKRIYRPTLPALPPSKTAVLFRQLERGKPVGGDIASPGSGGDDGLEPGADPDLGVSSKAARCRLNGIRDGAGSARRDGFAVLVLLCSVRRHLELFVPGSFISVQPVHY